jgi:hypothetical protein
MAKITVKHVFLAKMMVDAFEQEDTTFDTLPVINNLNVSKAASKGCNPCRAATKAFEMRGIQTPAHPSTPLTLGKTWSWAGKVKDFFHCNPTPSCVEIINDKDKQIPIRGSTATTSASSRTNFGANLTSAATKKISTAATTVAAAVAATASTATGLNATIAGNPPKEFYNQLIATMRNLQ